MLHHSQWCCINQETGSLCDFGQKSYIHAHTGGTCCCSAAISAVSSQGGNPLGRLGYIRQLAVDWYAYRTASWSSIWCMPVGFLHRLQVVQNNAARVIHRLPGHGHITPVLRDALTAHQAASYIQAPDTDIKSHELAWGTSVFDTCAGAAGGSSAAVICASAGCTPDTKVCCGQDSWCGDSQIVKHFA